MTCYRPCVRIYIPPERRKRRRRISKDEVTKTLTDAEIAQFEQYYEIESADPLVLRVEQSKEESILRKHRYFTTKTTYNNMYSLKEEVEKSTDSFPKPTGQSDIQPSSQSILTSSLPSSTIQNSQTTLPSSSQCPSGQSTHSMTQPSSQSVLKASWRSFLKSSVQSVKKKSSQSLTQSILDSVMKTSSQAMLKQLLSEQDSAPDIELTPNPRPVEEVVQHLDWKNYHRLGVIHQFMEDLEAEFPSLCTTGIIGKSLEGRDLKILKISNSNATNESVWIDAGIHAREWIAPAVNTFVANYIARNFDALSLSMRNKDWYFHPVVNPDGYEYTHTHNRMWRKNKARLNSDLVGVDLNRNFSYAWGGKGSSDEPTHAFYRGPRPFSEPESSAIRDVLMKSGVRFKVYVTLHSFGQVIIMPYAYTEKLAPDYIKLLEGATAMSRAIYDTNGNTYKVGVSKDVMYHASGTSNDWSHGVVGIPYCYLIELRSRKHKFKLPESEIIETGTEIVNSLIALMDFVDNYIPPKIKEPSSKLNSENVPREVAINIWNEDNCMMEIMVEGPKAATVATLLHGRDLPYSIALPDVNTMYEKEQYHLRHYFLGTTIMKPVMDWKNYHRLDTIYAFMDKLAADYPYLCSVSVIGRTAEGRDLKLLKISNGDDNNEGVWLDGAIHAREWISPAVVTYIADNIVKHFHEYPDSITKKDWYILPIFNPDGYEYTHTTDRMWRKNRAKYGDCVGVDLNRNWSIGWGEKGEEGSSKEPGNIFYRGPKAFSEAETIAVKHTILDSRTKFKVFLSFHSYGDAILFPWGYTSEPCPDYVTLLEGGTAVAKAIYNTSGRLYKVGGTKDLMYYASGNSIDWSYEVAKIPFSYMFELRGKKHKFLLPKEEIIVTATEIFSGVRKLLEFVDERGSDMACSSEAT